MNPPNASGPAGALTDVPARGFEPVAVSDMDKELNARWKALAQTRDDALALRSCTLNLIVLAEHPRDSAGASSVVSRLSRAHPIRAIIVSPDVNVPEDSVQSWLKVECDEKRPAAALCSVEILLATNPDSIERTVSAIRGLLAADLPVVLWWRGGPPLRNRLFRGLTRFADKIVVDSARFGDGEPGLDTLRRIVEHEHHRAAIADFNWQRTRAWRVAIAACFDHREVLALLSNFDRCSIEFATAAARTTPPSARALLLAGWLVSRAPQFAGRVLTHPKHDERAAPGSILFVTLHASKNSSQLCVSWRGSSDDLAADIAAEDGHPLRRWLFKNDMQDETDLLHDSIDVLSPNPLLVAALS